MGVGRILAFGRRSSAGAIVLTLLLPGPSISERLAIHTPPRKFTSIKDGNVHRASLHPALSARHPALNFFLANRQRDLWRRDPVAGDLNINVSLEQLVLDSMKLREADEAKAKVIEHKPTEPEKTKG